MTTRSRLELPNIYPITDTRISGLSHTEQVRRLIAGGAKLIQLREKHLPPLDWIDDAREAVRIAHEAGAKVIVNDRVDIAMVLHADGVHLGQDDLPPQEARKLLGDGAIIGYSTHSLKQAVAALELPIDYVAVGPVFATSTKADHEPVIGLALLSNVRQAVRDRPIVAIGGINAENISQVLAAGADSAAMISEIVSFADNIASRFSELTSLSQMRRTDPR